VDTGLRVTDPSLERQRTEIAEALVQPLAIIEHFDEFEHLRPGLLTRVVIPVMNQLILERLKKLSTTALS
jgi:hypothetical protein